MLLPINTLREIAKLFPDHQDCLDDWQRGFCTDQISRLNRWGDEIRLSEKQAAVLQKCLQTLQNAAGGEA